MPMLTGPSSFALAALCSVAALMVPAALGGGPPADRPRPTMSEFVGLCGHFHFDAPTFAPVARHVRNYHGINWDLDTKVPYKDPPYPFALNRVNWETLYGGWQAAGFEINSSLMLGDSFAEDAEDPEGQAYGYGRAFAEFMGPSGKGLVHTAELGNEPGDHSDEDYTAVAHAMARGLKEGDPLLRVATASVTIGKSGQYEKSIACYDGWMDLIDVLNVHSYAMMGSWPNRLRTHPEDPECDFLKRVQRVLDWRDANAPDKDVWVTEFGWDAHRMEGAPLQEGTPIHERPSVVSRIQQAQFLARAYLIFARMGVDRAYMFWYQDDGPGKGMHNADGLLSKGEKQPAYYAMASMKRHLGSYRFERVLEEDLDSVYAYLLTAGPGRACVAAWSPTFDGESRDWTLDLEAAALGDFSLVRAMELATGAEQIEVDAEAAGGKVNVQAVGMPRLLFLRR